MAELARQDCREPLIQRLAQTYPSPLFIDQAFRLSWVVVPDPDEYEFVRAPKLQAEQYFDSGVFQGDCDDAATLASCMLCALDWRNWLIAIRRPREEDFSHVFTSAVESGYRVDIDPIVPAHRMPIPASEIAETIAVFL
jgi:hypothetical protein